MPINSTSVIPKFCKNCIHRFVCSIQSKFTEKDKDNENFNKDNSGNKQSTSGTHLCGYKIIDTTI